MVQGGGGEDKAIGGSGADTMGGGEGRDELWGEGAADTLDGGPDNDILHSSRDGRRATRCAVDAGPTPAMWTATTG